MQTIAVARNAMATRFEIVLHGDDPVLLRAAGEEALDEITRIEARFSLYRSSSDIARVNANAARFPVQVTPEVFHLLQRAQRLSREAGGAFDISIAPLVRCWGFMGGTGRMPGPGELTAALAVVGMDLVELREEDFSVRFAREGVMLDLGAIGKGYALERAAELMREAGVTSALLHGGTSTALALGHPPEQEHWKIAIESPPDTLPTGAFALLATVPLRDESLSVSAVWGRSFQSAGKNFGHVLDPRTGQPVAGTLLTVVVLPSATETDALSTALLVLGEPGHEQLARLRPGARTLVVTQDASAPGFTATARGISITSGAASNRAG